MPPKKTRTAAKKTASTSKAVSKRGRQKSHSGSDSEEPAKKKAAKPALKSRAKIPDVSKLNFDNDAKTSNGKKWNIKISSWNVNGIRAWLEKNGPSFIEHEDPDVFCIQETKCSNDKIPAKLNDMEGYHCYWLSGDKEGYSGVGLMSKKEPKSVHYGIGVQEHDNEGRVITAEFDKFYVVNTYVPNAGRGLVRLDYRMKWDTAFRKYLKKLDSKKQVILCGDLNVAHQEIDLASPKTNKKTAGFTQEERDDFSTLLEEGFTDSYRHLYPETTGAYTFWTYMMNARAKNAGWRLDYFVLSEKLLSHLCDCVIRKDVFGSDHCPLTLFLSF